MDYALSAAFVGPVMLDSITRAKSGRTYDCEVQHPRMASNDGDDEIGSITYKMQLYCPADPPQAGDVVHISGSLLATAEPCIRANTFWVLLRGDIPDTFDPPSGSVVSICRCDEVSDDETWIRCVYYEYDPRTGSRICCQLIVERPMPLMQNAPVPRVGTYLNVRGVIKTVSDVTNLFTITAESIQFLPLGSGSTSSAPSTPRKRSKYNSKSLYGNSANSSGGQAPIDEAGPSTASTSTVEAASPSPSTPSTSTSKVSAASSSNNKGKGRATANNAK